MMAHTSRNRWIDGYIRRTIDLRHQLFVDATLVSFYHFLYSIVLKL